MKGLVALHRSLFLALFLGRSTTFALAHSSGGGVRPSSAWILSERLIT